MLYLISEIILYLLAALLIGFIMGWMLRGLQQSRYTQSLQQELDKHKDENWYANNCKNRSNWQINL